MVLVDSSVWIDFLTGAASPHNTALQAMISDGKDICLTDVNLMEVLRGIDDDILFQKVKRSLLRHPVLTAQGLSTHIAAANMYRAARRRGVTIKSTFDCLIAAIAIENNAAVLSRDKDFEALTVANPELRIIAPKTILAPTD